MHYYQRAKKLLQELIAFNNSPLWVQHVKNTNVQGYKFDPVDPVNIIVKSVGVINVSAEFVLKMVFDINQRKEIEEMFLEGRVVDPITDDLQIIYQKNKSKLFIPGRDFVMLYYKEKLDGKYYYVCQSTQLPDIPPIKECVRATVNLCGYVIEPLSENSS